MFYKYLHCGTLVYPRPTSFLPVEYVSISTQDYLETSVPRFIFNHPRDEIALGRNGPCLGNPNLSYHAYQSANHKILFKSRRLDTRLPDT
jgi:hypothetical protein